MEIFKLFGSIFVDNERANQAIDETDGKAEKTSGTFGKLGGAATALGGVLAGGLAAGFGAVVAGAGGLIMAGDNLQKSLNGLQTQTGATDEEMKDMEESLKNIYKNNYGESFQDIADTMAIAKQTTGEWGEDLQYLAQDALMFRDTFGYDTQESIRSADKLMKQFGLTGTDAMAFIAEGSQKGLDFAQDLLPTIDEYSVYFKQAGMDAQDMFGVFENAKQAGVFNLDYAADAFKEFGIIMTEDSTRASDALAKVGLNGEKLRQEFAAGGEGAKSAFQTIAEAVGSVEDPLLQSQLLVELFGTKAEDMGASAVVAMSQVNESITGNIEVLNSINEIKYDSFGEALQGIGRNLLMGVFEPFQQKVMPIINEFANWIATQMPVVEQITNQTFTVIFDAASKVWSFLKDNIIPIFQRLFSQSNENMPVIQTIFQSVFSAITEVAKTVWNFFKENLLPIFVDLYKWVQGNMPAIRETTSAVFNNIREVVSGVWSFFKDNLLPIFASLLSWVQSKMPQIRSIVETAFKLIANVVKTAWDIFENMLLPVLKALWDFIEPVFPVLGEIVGSAFEYIIDVVEAVIVVFERVTAAIKAAVEWLTFWNDAEAEEKEVNVKTNYSSTGTGGVPKNYVGTNNFRGGATWVGEHGPELLQLPRGSKIHSANDSRRMSGVPNIKQEITINSPKALSPSEIARKNLQVSRQLALEWGL